MGSLNTPRLGIVNLTEQVGFKVVSISAMLHIVMELKYMIPLVSIPKGYYNFF